MEITINKDDLVEKLFAQIMKNVESNLEGKELTEEEVQANLVLAKKAANNDANAIANLVFLAFAE